MLGALIAVYLATSAGSRQVAAVSRMNEDASIALNLMGSQLRMAGFSLPRRDVPSGGALVDGVLVSIPDRNFIGAGVRGCDHGFVDPKVASFDDLACASGPTTAPAALAIRYEGAESTDVLAALLPPSMDCLNQAVAANTAGPLGMNYPLVESRYLARVGASSGTPELFCAGSGGASFAAHPVIQFVEHMTISYGIAADSKSHDVQADVTASAIDALGGSVDQRWSRVVTVRLCIVLRSAGRAAVDDGAYLDCNGDRVASSDGFLRRAYSQVFALRNRGGFAGGAS